MGYLNETVSNAGLIRSILRTAIINSVHEAWYRTAPVKPEEPDFVAALVAKAVPEIASNLRLLFGPHGIKVATTGVFCHQTPKVRHTLASKSCELGDVLFVHAHRVGSDVTRNALLLQAKVTAGKMKYKIPTSDHHQLNLYRKWPQFTYQNSGPALNGQVRNVDPKSSHSGAQYLLIDDTQDFDPRAVSVAPSGHYPMAVWMAETLVYASQPLESELLLFLLNKTGRAFGDPKNPEEWTKVVWDLLKIGLVKAFNRKRSRYSNQDRTAGDSVFFLMNGVHELKRSVVLEALVDLGVPEVRAQHYLNVRGDLPPEELFPDHPEPESGMTLIIIETEGENEVEQ